MFRFHTIQPTFFPFMWYMVYGIMVYGSTPNNSILLLRPSHLKNIFIIMLVQKIFKERKISNNNFLF